MPPPTYSDYQVARDALETIARMVIPTYAMINTDDGTSQPVVKLEFATAVRDIAREAIHWQPDVLDELMQLPPKK
jgi:hypothetical protein